ncbi:MAG: protein translocase subunit SecD [Bacillota bacterium]
MNSKNLLLFLLLVALISFLAYLTFFGLDLGKFDIVPAKNLIKQGLDLRGGVTVLLEAKDSPNDPVTDEKMNRAKETLSNRIDTLGVTEPTIVRVGERRIEILLPDIKDPQQAMEIIGKTAKLEFKDEAGNVVLTGEDIKGAEVVFSGATGVNNPEVSLKLSPEGIKKFAKATTENVGKKIIIYLDEIVISDPIVNSPIEDGNAVITNIGDMEEAKQLATLIQAGALPVEMAILSKTAVGPQLGADAYSRTITAGLIGIGLVMLFMVAYYRIPGLIADLSLLLYMVITLGALAYFKATLTLPGIAGIILSVGMAVDANVIIYERMKDELKLGKTLRASIDAGFRRAFLTIVDSNITTLIAAGILFYFGTGPLKGFAVTLSIGIAASMFTSIVLSRYLIKLLVGSNLIKNTKLYGA